ncbi:hypothetical protein I7X12_20220 [Halosimplex litoreum]|uniref:Uncharacterized protein n=1 Tax=Halosimplex litoreum TaxID=1198301 RepID=A0A7T3FYD3_9EURY|nr:hypothetical protein [Halosimplex litoreum]QPV63006.1 hypothetical protein I7X12_20220 [Halosimplex litoreum]
MRAVTKHLDEKARSIFADLGYTVTDSGGEYLAERKWRSVHVTPAEEFDEAPASGEYRCFVAWSDDVPDLERRLEAADPDYEWAIMGVDEDGDYEVACHRNAA